MFAYLINFEDLVTGDQIISTQDQNDHYITSGSNQMLR